MVESANGNGVKGPLDFSSLPPILRFFLYLFIYAPVTAGFFWMLAQSAGYIPSELQKHVSAETAFAADVRAQHEETRQLITRLTSSLTTALIVDCENRAPHVIARNNCQRIGK